MTSKKSSEEKITNIENAENAEKKIVEKKTRRVSKKKKGDKLDKRKNRSDSYQHLLLESSFSHDMMENFSNTDSIYNRLNPWQYDERIIELADELKKEFWKVIDEHLTDRQKQVVKLYSQGLTQMEIAKILGVNQSSITKSINGNVDYKSGKRSYGGVKVKIKKVIKNHPKIKELLDKINELRNDVW